MAFLWLIHGGDPNYLLSGVILQSPNISGTIQMEESENLWIRSTAYVRENPSPKTAGQKATSTSILGTEVYIL